MVTSYFTILSASLFFPDVVCSKLFSFKFKSYSGSLNVYHREEGGGLNFLWTVDEDMNDHWRPMQITISSVSKFQVQTYTYKNKA